MSPVTGLTASRTFLCYAKDISLIDSPLNAARERERTMQHKIQFLIISLIGILVLSGCAFGADNSTKPALKLNVAPEVDGLVVGQIVNIQAIAVDQNGDMFRPGMLVEVKIMVEPMSLSSLFRSK